MSNVRIEAAEAFAQTSVMGAERSDLGGLWDDRG